VSEDRWVHVVLAIGRNNQVEPFVFEREADAQAAARALRGAPGVEVVVPSKRAVDVLDRAGAQAFLAGLAPPPSAPRGPLRVVR
jgi:hypothetical protein